VPGANDEAIDLNSSVFSLGSNTANAVAPILKALDSKVGVERAFLTTVHGYSNSNRLADVAGAGFRKNRAAGENIIPSVTNSSKVIESALPMLKDKIASFSMTVPVPDGSTIDLTLNLKTKTSKDEVNSYLEKVTADNSLKNIIGFTYDPIVSSDVVGNSLSGLIDGLSTMCIDEDKLKLIIWFDNGWGYASRIIEAVKSSEVQFE
jgi:glyceraldehyde 3-phosphate dehydrogenase